MSINVTCSRSDCGGVFKVADRLAGKTIKCPKCGSPIEVEAAEGAPLDIVADGTQRLCPGCSAPLGPDDVFCIACGTDLRPAGATPQEEPPKKARNLTPLVVGGMMAAAFLVLVILAVAVGIFIKGRFAGKEGGAKAEGGGKAVVQKQDGDEKGPEVGGAGEAAPEPEPEPEPLWEIPKEDLAALAQREKQLQNAVAGYIVKLKEVYAHLREDSPDDYARGWADLYAYCRDNGLQIEAERCWFRAVSLRPTDAAVNAVLGRTATFAGVPVTPTQKEFLAGLAPRLLITNSDPDLVGLSVQIEGGAAVPLTGAVPVSLPVQVGTVKIQVLRAEGGAPVRQIILPIRPATVHELELVSLAAAPTLQGNFFSDVRSALKGDRRRRGATAVRDAGGNVVKVSLRGAVVTAPPGAPLLIQQGARGDYAMNGRIALGNPNSVQGASVLDGTGGQPVRWAEPGRGEPAVLMGGVHYVLRTDLCDPLWRVLATASADLAGLWVHGVYARHLDRAHFENVQLEAEGKLAGPWQELLRVADELRAIEPGIARAVELQAAAAALPPYRDRVRALGLEPGREFVHLNWPRFAHAIAAVLAADPAVLTDRFGLAQDVPEERAEDSAVAGTRVGMESSFIPRAPGVRRREATLTDIMPLLPDAFALQFLQESWGELEGPARQAALFALEQIGSPAVVSFLGDVSKSSGSSREVMQAVLSLGAIGTPEALREVVGTPGIVAEVRLAATAARAAMGDPDLHGLALAGLLKDADAFVWAALLRYVTELNTPATLLVLSQAIDTRSDDESQQDIAKALAAAGGHCAVSELARLIQRSGKSFPEALALIDPRDALPLVRWLGTSLAEGKGGAEAIRLLAGSSSGPSAAFLKLLVMNKKDAKAFEALLRQGSRSALETARPAVGLLKPELLQELAKTWYSLDEETGRCLWSPDVDSGAVIAFLGDALSDEGVAAPVRLLAAAMLQEVGSAPALDPLLTLARGQQVAQEEGGEGTEVLTEFSEFLDVEEPEEREEEVLYGAFEEEEEGSFVSMAPYTPAGYRDADGRPVWPIGSSLKAKPQLYALGVLVAMGGDQVSEGLRALIDTHNDAQLLGATVYAVGELGGQEGMAFLRQKAITHRDKYANSNEFLAEFQMRLAALDALANAGDKTMLMPLLDMFVEEPPRADAITGMREPYLDLIKWWQIKLRTAACRCLASLCRNGLPDQLVSGNPMIRTQLLQQIVQFMEKRSTADSLAQEREKLRSAAVRAFGCIADPNAAQTRQILNHLMLDVGTVRVGGRGRRSKEKLTDHAKAVLDAFASLGARAGDPGFIEPIKDLLKKGVGASYWAEIMAKMAADPTDSYLRFLSGTFGRLSASGRETVVMRLVDGPVASKDAVADLVAQLVAGSPDWSLSGVAGAFGQEDYDDERYEQYEEEEEYEEYEDYGEYGEYDEEDARLQAMWYKRRARPRRRVWSYPSSEIYKAADALRRRWQWVETLFRLDAPGIGGLVAQHKLLELRDMGPAVGALYVLGSPSAAPEFMTAMVKQIAEGSSGYRQEDGGDPMQVGERAAVAALRRVGGERAAQALYTGLVGPALVRGPGDEPEEPEYEEGEGGALLFYVARALGSMGRGDLLDGAMNATNRAYFRANRMAVAKAALHGMAFMPLERDPVKVLVSWLGRLRRWPELQKTAAEGVRIALRRAQRVPASPAG